MPDSHPHSAPKPMQRPAGKPWIPAAALGGRIQTALLVEDSRHAAEAVRQLARHFALRLRRAETLRSARTHLARYSPDILIVDPGLPDGNGLDLFADLRSKNRGDACGGAGRSPAWRAVITADPESARDAQAAGADAVILKPLCVPHDLALLFGPDALNLPDTIRTSRLAPADPLTLRDDLRAAAKVLHGQENPDLGYINSFLAGVARCSGSPPLYPAMPSDLGLSDVDRLGRQLRQRLDLPPGASPL